MKLAQGGGFGIVLNRGRQAQARFKELLQGNIDPAGHIGWIQHHAPGMVEWAGAADAQGGDRLRGRQTGLELCHTGGNTFDHGGRTFGNVGLGIQLFYNSILGIDQTGRNLRGSQIYANHPWLCP